ncbi:MAG: maltotransferase domain-containing protein, partial [Microbacterium sp.]
MAARTVLRPAALRSTAQVPLRPAVEPPDAAPGTRTGRIPLADASPAAPEGFSPKAFVGEAVPFRVVAFREGHDLIGARVRLRSPGGEESLHRLSPQEDGT